MTIPILHLPRPSCWNQAPAPSNQPFYAKAKHSTHYTKHSDPWLVKDIHGPDYQWAPIIATTHLTTFRPI